MSDTPREGQGNTPYRVLARKYRPATFDDLIGQDALVRTLTNAMHSGRLAHAFILTGVRGVGKTTTARIIARALNCTGPDGENGPTPNPCGTCSQCTAIAQDRHIDVFEMDAASRTGVDDIRELIESVRYRPVEARYKVYVIDEVHMLSKNAFNALLKTLEEPPEHVIFIFATTEIRKVPITVLSRCQRFDLRRVEQDRLEAHFAAICAKEEVAGEEAALKLIARAADGSVRDGLSLLDQAIALGGGVKVEESEVRNMLGLADRTRVFDLFEAALGGKSAETLGLLDELYRVGADPAVVIQDLLELTHLLSRAKLVPESLKDEPEAERERGGALIEKLSIAELARCWQLLLKGVDEVRGAPLPRQAAEMILIRLIYAGNLPTPGDLVRRLSRDENAEPKAKSPPSEVSTPAPPASAAVVAPSGGASGMSGSRGARSGLALDQARVEEVSPAEDVSPPEEVSPPEPPLPTHAPETYLDDPGISIDKAPSDAPSSRELPATFEKVVELVESRRAMMLANQLRRDVHLVSFEPGRIEFRPSPSAAGNLAQDLGKFLREETGERWMVTLSQDGGAETLEEAKRRREEEKRAAAIAHPLVQAAMTTFPGATLVGRRDKSSHSARMPEDSEGQSGE